MPKADKKTEVKYTKREVLKPRSKSSGLLLGGVKDIIGKDQRYWQLLRNKVEQLAKDYGYNRIDPPIIEKTILYEKGLGKNNEILDKIFSLTDNTGENISLRPAATFSLARALNDQRMENWIPPIKLYYIGPMFLYDQERGNNYRQFYQFGFELLASDQPVVDAQMILIAYNFYKDLEVATNVQINSIGCPTCRVEYRKTLIEHYRQKKNLLCPDCKESFNKNPLSIFRCQVEKCQELKEDVPQIIDHLCEECKNHFIRVLEYLDDLELPYILNPFLVRETDYGTKTVFELWPEESEKVKQPLAKGGRYDNLIKSLGGEATPACGFAIDMEQAIVKIKEVDLVVPEKESYDVFLAQLGEQARRKSLQLFEDLKEKGIKVAESFSQNGLKPQLETAKQLNVKFVLILGQKEVLDNTIMIRDMDGGMQEIIDYTKVALEVQKRLKKE